jgi:hypothetical protein
MLFSISVSFTNKNVNHTVIFELKKLYKNKNNYESKNRLNLPVTYVFVCFSKYTTSPGVMIIVPTPHRRPFDIPFDQWSGLTKH